MAGIARQIPCNERRIAMACLRQCDRIIPRNAQERWSDGIVGWEGCVGRESEHHSNIAVDSVSHWGMLHSPEVLQAVARLLAEPEHRVVRILTDKCASATR